MEKLVGIRESNLLVTLRVIVNNRTPRKRRVICALISEIRPACVTLMEDVWMEMISELQIPGWSYLRTLSMYRCHRVGASGISLDCYTVTALWLEECRWGVRHCWRRLCDWVIQISQRTHDAIITSLWRQNDVVLTSWWRYYCVVCPFG